MRSSFTLACALLLAFALAGCTRPQESTSTSQGELRFLVLENRAWSADENGPLKIVVLDVTSNGSTRLSWQDLALDTTPPTGPTSAYRSNATDDARVAWTTPDVVIGANETVRIELHYRGNSTSEPTRLLYDAGRIVAISLPAPTRAS